MKKSIMIKKLHKFLQQYDSCKIRQKETKEILNFLESQGMMPPGVFDHKYFDLYGHEYDYEPIVDYMWDKE